MSSPERLKLAVAWRDTHRQIREVERKIIQLIIHPAGPNSTVKLCN